MRIQEIAPGQKRSVPLSIGEEKFRKFWDGVIAKRCTEIIKIYLDTNRFLYRGVEDMPPAFRGMSRENRWPKDSDHRISLMFDQLLAANGMVALRGNSIFTTSYKQGARSFGPTYIIFPFDGFNFTYTNQKDDLVLGDLTSLMDMDVFWHFQKKFQQCRANMDPAKADTISERYAWIDWQTKSIDDAINTLKRMCVDDPEVEALTPEQLISPETIKKRYNPRNTNLAYAMEEELEIYISGQYYALLDDRYRTMIERAMGVRFAGED